MLIYNMFSSFEQQLSGESYALKLAAEGDAKRFQRHLRAAPGLPEQPGADGTTELK
jgi:hypothetical protein